MKAMRASWVVVFMAGAAAVRGAPEEKAATALDVKASGVKTFYADDRAGNNQVTFISESTLEDFTGVCNKVAGQATFDPKRVESLAGRFAIRPADMSTGIELRDHHLRSADWLDAEKYPEIVVTIEGCEGVKRTSANMADATLVGACELHGVKKAVRIPASIAYLDESPKTMKRVKGDLLRIRAEFGVKLADYGIKGPAGSDTVGTKVAEETKVKVTVFASTEKPAEALKADRPSAASNRAGPAPRRK